MVLMTAGQGLQNPEITPRQLKDMKPELALKEKTQLETEYWFQLERPWWGPGFQLSSSWPAVPSATGSDLNRR